MDPTLAPHLAMATADKGAHEGNVPELRDAVVCGRLRLSVLAGGCGLTSEAGLINLQVYRL